MAKTARGYHHGDLARALMDAALGLVQRDGEASFTLREAARQVGVNHAAVYRHFADKTALLAAIAHEGWVDLVERFAAALPAPCHDAGAADDGDAGARDDDRPAVERLVVVARTYARFAFDRPAHYRVMHGPRLNLDGRHPELEGPLEEALDVVRREVQRGIDRKELAPRDPTTAALGLWANLHGVLHLHQMRRLRVKKAAAEAFVLALVRPAIVGLTLP
ncbi:MAG: TetR/AcrR family transcriptional regulator [Myxococcota bacterium]